MQQDCQLGIPPPSSRCFLHSLPSLCAVFLLISLSLTASLYPLYPGVTDYHSADSCSGECTKMTHNTPKQEQAHTRTSPPAPLPLSTHLFLPSLKLFFVATQVSQLINLVQSAFFQKHYFLNLLQHTNSM